MYPLLRGFVIKMVIRQPLKIGIIGGTGLEKARFFQGKSLLSINTRFGKPSSKIIKTKFGTHEIFLLARHGLNHSITPSRVPYQANIASLKKLGCTHIIATSACGSLREKIKPGDLVFPDQFIDRTTQRASTFFDEDEVLHAPMAEPFCQMLRKDLVKIASKLKYRHHSKATIVTIEGPRFSTRAESKMFRLLGGDIINMSTVPEAVLAREAAMHYALIAMSTDYDCWRKATKAVDARMIFETMSKNVAKVEKILEATLGKIGNYSGCMCQNEISKII